MLSFLTEPFIPCFIIIFPNPARKCAASLLLFLMTSYFFLLLLKSVICLSGWDVCFILHTQALERTWQGAAGSNLGAGIFDGSLWESRDRDSPSLGHGTAPQGQDRTSAELQTCTAAGSLGRGLTAPRWAEMGAVGRGWKASQVELGKDSKICECCHGSDVAPQAVHFCYPGHWDTEDPILSCDGLRLASIFAAFVH